MRDTLSPWQTLFKQGFSSSAQLLAHLGLDESLACEASDRQFVTRVPKRFVDKMRRGDASDPLLLQVLAQAKEQDIAPGFSHDPLHEEEVNPIQGLLHKYPGRVLLTLSSVCAINCRYCFRRHFPYRENTPGRKGFERALDYIRNDESIQEVIFSGGDPLMLKNDFLSDVLVQLEDIAHVTTLRVHTRVPIVLPERIDEAFLSLFSSTRLNKVMVMHCNHAQELDEDIETACRQLRAVGFHLLNQAVLLKGVNDNLKCLTQLSQALFEFGILPYYLHCLDKVQGSQHFELSVQQSQVLHLGMQASLPGYLVPKLVAEIAGKKHKIWCND